MVPYSYHTISGPCRIHLSKGMVPGCHPHALRFQSVNIDARISAKFRITHMCRDECFGLVNDQNALTLTVASLLNI